MTEYDGAWVHYPTLDYITAIRSEVERENACYACYAYDDAWIQSIQEGIAQVRAGQVVRYPAGYLTDLWLRMVRDEEWLPEHEEC